MSKHNAEIYHRAAAIMENGSEEYCCWAISRACGEKEDWHDHPKVRAFDQLFCNPGDDFECNTTIYLRQKMTFKEAQQLRVWILLLMAAISATPNK